MSKRMNKALARMKSSLRRAIHAKVDVQGKWLHSVFTGWLNDYAVPGSYRYLKKFRHRLIRIWYMILRRRSQRPGVSWDVMYRIATFYLPKVTIRHPWPDKRFDVRMRGRSPVC